MKAKLVPANLTVETFIQRTMAGEVFYYAKGQLELFYCQEASSNPFQVRASNGVCKSMEMLNLWEAVHNLYTREPITWREEVSENNPVLCWVSQAYRGTDPGRRDKAMLMTRATSSHVFDIQGTRWNYATPVKPSECWGGEE